MTDQQPHTPAEEEHAGGARPGTDTDTELARPAPNWPPLEWETYDWRIRDTYISNIARRRYAGPYEAAVTPAIADLTPTVDPAVAAEADEAIAEIIRFDTATGQRLLPFASLLLRSESAASSQIEQLTASAKAIALAELDDGRRTGRNAATIVSNVTAMNAALALADRLDTESILAMHTALLEHDHPEWVGHWRDEQVWIGGHSQGPHGALFIAPHHTRVPAAMDDLVAFANRTDIAPLVHVAVTHAQFETIHPFPDGNGRAGRALVHAMLRHRGITRTVTVPISAGLLVDTGAYFDALGDYRAGHLEPIVQQMADASFNALGNAQQMIDELDAIHDDWNSRITARSDSSVWPLTRLLGEQPAVTSNLVADRLDISIPAALNAISRLEETGILVKAKGEERNRAWVAVDVIAVLDRFAERGGRRNQA